MKRVRLSVIIIMIGTLLSKVLGLLRDVILASSFGATAVSDAYLISTTIPSLIVGAVATAILSTYIPVLNSALKESEEKAQEFNDNAIFLSIVLVTVIVGIFFLFPDFIVSLFVIGFSDDNLNLVINMTKITVFMSYFLILISIFSGYLQNKNKFRATSFNGIIFNTVSIIGIILSARHNVYIMAFTFVLGYLLATLHLFRQCWKNGMRIKFRFDIRNPYIKKLVILTIPVVFNSMVWDVNVMIDKTLTSTIGAGYISGLNYSYKIINVAIDIFAVSIATFIFPKLSRAFHEQNTSILQNTLKNSVNLILLLLIPVMFIIIAFSPLIVQILFMRGSFDEFALNITSNSLKLYALLLSFTGINTIIYKFYNALELNKIPAINALISIVLNIILNLAFIGPLGYRGIILATVLSTCFASIMILFKLRKHIEFSVYKNWLLNCLRAFASSAVSIVIATAAFNIHFVNSVIVNLAISCVIFLIIYVFMLLLFRLKIKEIVI